MNVIGEAIRDRQVKVVAVLGPGGVGKTTTAAALGMAAAQAGRRVVVLTIDPARRLAQALGMDEVGDEPRAVPHLPPSDGDQAGTGSLEVMMLDMQRTFDELVRSRTEPATAERILANPMYESLSSSLAGTQEFMAMERLGQLSEQVGPQRRWDLIVVDTPPSGAALDFLDAPSRLGRFLDSRLFRLLTAPARLGTTVGSRALAGGRGHGVARRVMSALLGPGLVDDIEMLLGAMSTVLTGFGERAAQTRALLASDETALLVVTAPEAGPAAEARSLVGEMRRDGLAPRAVIVNRVVTAPRRPGVRAATDALAAAGDGTRPHSSIAAAALDVQVRRAQDARRHATVVGDLRRDLTSSETPVTSAPAADGDVHAMAELSALGRSMLG